MKKLSNISLVLGAAFVMTITSVIPIQAEPTPTPQIQKPTPASEVKTHQSSDNKSNSIQNNVYTPQNKTFTVGGVSFVMVEVRGGTFTMGATAEQGSDALDNEKPTHKVTLPSYYIGQTEVTQALWEVVMNKNPSNHKGSVLPVEMVSWNDVKAFISKLNDITGEYFRLPTEAEWEFAARGGTMSQDYKYSGSSNIRFVAWYKDNAGGETQPVGKRVPNELGIYDMSGNVWEWCQDWKDNYSAQDDYNPAGPGSGSERVNRGGSYFSNAKDCRVSDRNYYAPDIRFDNLGFRLAL